MSDQNVIYPCIECGKRLTPYEREYFDNRCDECERKWQDRVENWRLGGEDEYLDSLFSVD